MTRTPNKDNAIEGAVAILSIIVLLYLITLTMLIKTFSDFGPVSKDKTMFVGLAIAILVYCLNLKYFKGKAESIASGFTGESKKQKILGSIFVLLIGIGSLGSLIAVGILLK